MAQNDSILGGDTGAGPFQEYLSRPLTAVARQAQLQTVPPATGNEGKLGQTAYMLTSFLAGADASRQRDSIQKLEQQRQDREQLSRAYAFASRPGVDPEAAAQVQAEIVREMGSHAVEEAKKAGSKNPILGTLAMIGQHMLGGPEQKYEKLTPERVNELWAKAAQVPTAAATAKSELTPLMQNINGLVQRLTTKEGVLPTEAMLRSNMSPEDVSAQVGFTTKYGKDPVSEFYGGNQLNNPASYATQVQNSQIEGGLKPESSPQQTLASIAYMLKNKDPRAKRVDRYIDGVPTTLYEVAGKGFVGDDGVVVPNANVKTAQEARALRQAPFSPPTYAANASEAQKYGLPLDTLFMNARDPKTGKMSPVLNETVDANGNVTSTPFTRSGSVTPAEQRRDSGVMQRYTEETRSAYARYETARLRELAKLNSLDNVEDPEKVQDYLKQLDGILKEDLKRAESNRDLLLKHPEMPVPQPQAQPTAAPPVNPQAAAASKLLPATAVNNNPLAMMTQGQGGAQSINTYQDPTVGWRAGILNLQTKIQKLGPDGTLAQLTQIWAPREDKRNNPEAYAASVAKELGINNPNPKLSEVVNRLPQLAMAMARVEAGPAGYDWLNQNPPPGYAVPAASLRATAPPPAVTPVPGGATAAAGALR